VTPLYMFGVSTRRPSRRAARKMQLIAQRHDADLIEADMPDGYRRWYQTRDYGWGSNQATERAVRADLEGAGLAEVRS